MDGQKQLIEDPNGSLRSPSKDLRIQSPEENKTMDYLQSTGYYALYNLHSNTRSNAKPAYFSSFEKLFVTGTKVEIKTPNHLPVLLLHKQFDVSQILDPEIHQQIHAESQSKLH